MGFKYLSKKEEKVLERTDQEEYQKYYRYSRYLYEQSTIANLSLETRKKIRPLLRKALQLMNRLNGNKIIVLGNEEEKSNKPKIYAITHIGKFDIEMISEVLSEHTYILSGDFENLHRTFSGIFLELNGIIYVNERDKEDRKNSRLVMEQTLRNGGNIMYFPEGTWNMTPSSPMLKLYPGIVDIAINGGAEIVPVAIEQYGHKFVAKIGKNIDPSIMLEEGLSKPEILEQLRDLMATLKWELYESVPAWSEGEVSQDRYQQFVDDRMAEWPGFTLEEVLEKEYKPSSIVSPDEAFEHLEHLIPSPENAFLLRKEYYPKKR